MYTLYDTFLLVEVDNKHPFLCLDKSIGELDFRQIFYADDADNEEYVLENEISVIKKYPSLLSIITLTS